MNEIKRLTQTEIAEHLGINQQRVSQIFQKLGIDWRSMTLDEVRLAYLGRLREVAAGQASLDGGYDLNKERAMTERVDRELKQLQLAEKKKQLVNVSELKVEIENTFTAFRQELLSRDDKLKLELDTLYGIDVDVSILNEHTYNALNHLARYLAGDQGDSSANSGNRAPTGEVGDNGVGGVVPRDECEVDGSAG